MGLEYNAWSIGTSLRNLERISSDVLMVFKDFEDKDFNRNNENQKKLFTEIVRRKLTRSGFTLSRSEEEKFIDKDNPFSEQEAKEFIKRGEEESTASKGYEPDKRARTFCKPFERLGLIKQVGNKKIVTNLGDKFINNEIESPDLLLNFALKWELPNSGDKSFKDIKDINIKPIVGMLALIDSVNEIWSENNKPVGLNDWESNLFIHTFVNYNELSNTVKKIIDTRIHLKTLNNDAEKKEYLKTFQNNYIADYIFRDPTKATSNKIDTAYRTLRDYTRQTVPNLQIPGLVEKRGYMNVDITQSSLEQTKQLVKNQLYKPIGFKSYDEYMDYLTDLDSFIAPWTEAGKEQDVLDSLDNLLDVNENEIENLINSQSIKLPVNNSNLLSDSQNISDRKTALKQKNAIELQSNYLLPEYITKLIDEFENIYKTEKKAIWLEYLQFLSMLCINDFKYISPNFKTNDEFGITFYAPRGVPDMTIEYETFYIVSEVTMQETRDQFVNEGTPVIRHIDQFKEKNSDKPTIGIFVAPTIHEDTFRYWFTTGKYQDTVIIPFSFEQWKVILKKYLKLRSDSKNPTNTLFKEFIFSLSPGEKDLKFHNWEERINNKVNEFSAL